MKVYAALVLALVSRPAHASGISSGVSCNADECWFEAEPPQISLSAVDDDLPCDDGSPSCMAYVQSLTPYHGYQGPLRVSGRIAIQTGAGSQVMRWFLSGADLNCGTVPPRPGSNDCGIHIHKGRSCAEDAGPHFHKGGDDPWKAVQYSVDLAAKRWSFQLGAPVHSGLSREEILGHTVVVHDKEGARIACGIIKETALSNKLATTQFVPYFGYKGRQRVSGNVYVAFTDDGHLVLEWDLDGVDANCLTGRFSHGPVSNDCGIHIHTGKSCEESAGGHLHKTASDPWKFVHYDVFMDPQMSATASYGRGVQVEAGLSREDVSGRTVVVHNLSGERIACATLDSVYVD